jgi:hypothetical protein
MKNSERNRAVIENFILHITHCSKVDYNEDDLMEFTPKQMYDMADDYIKEDHVDGEGNPDNWKDVREVRAVGVKIPMPNGYMMVDINLDDKEKAQVSFYNKKSFETNPKNPWIHTADTHFNNWGEPQVALCYDRNTSCFDDMHQIKEELKLKPRVRKFRVFAEISNRCYIDVEARTEDEARAKAEDIDGGEFIYDEDSGDWDIIKATKIS